MSLPHSNEICKKPSIAEFIGMGEPLWLTEFNLFRRHYRTPFTNPPNPILKSLRFIFPTLIRNLLLIHCLSLFLATNFDYFSSNHGMKSKVQWSTELRLKGQSPHLPAAQENSQDPQETVPSPLPENNHKISAIVKGNFQ